VSDQEPTRETSPDEGPEQPAPVQTQGQETAAEAGVDVAAEPEPEPVAETEQEAVAEPEALAEPQPDGTVTTPVPAPSRAVKPTPPGPRPVPRPPARRGRTATPAAVATHGSAVLAPPSLSETEVLEAAGWGRVTEDGTVWVREASGEREVGQYTDTHPADAIAFYVRRFADLHAKVVLFEARITATDLSVKEMDATLEHLASELDAPAAVGDLDGLRRRLDSLRMLAAARKAVADAERAAAKQVGLEARTAMVEAAEKIAATEPERMQWRPAGEQLRVLLEQWKEAQRRGPRLDRTNEDALWKRFSHARSTFDRERRRWFAKLEKSSSAARTEKEQLVTQAEALATSTEWAGTSAAFRDLMARWKTAGRASRKDDDALWARFRVAQDAFFVARDAHFKQTDAEFSANLEAKLALLEQAERLVPVTDIAAAKVDLRNIQERWERIGKVPRADIQRIESRLRAVETVVRETEQAKWQRSNPETRARAEGAAAQLVAAITALERDLQAAKDAGDARKVSEAEEALQARRSWLEQVERAAAESRG